MPRRALPKQSAVAIAALLLTPLAILSLGGTLFAGPDAARPNFLIILTDDQGYIRAVSTNPEISEALEDVGVKTFSFAIRCPPGHKAAVSLIGTDETGKVVKDTGFKVVGFHGREAQEEWIVRFARIDPKAMNEDYSGNIRWRMTCRSKSGSSVSSDRWDRDWLRMKGSVGTGIGLDADVNAPSLGKNYEVWRSESFRKGPRKGPDDGVIFRYRVLVKFAQFMPGDFEGFGHHSVEPADDM